MKRNEEKVSVYKYIIWGIIFVTLFCIFANSSTRDFFSKLSEIHKLKKNIAQMTAENEKFEKRLNYLKTKPKEMEKAVKADLNYVAENEVVYIFEEPEQDNTEDKNEN